LAAGLRALRRAIAFSFGAGLAFGVVIALLLAIVIWVAMPIKLVDDAAVYRPRTPLQGMDAAKGCGTADKLPPRLPTASGEAGMPKNFAESLVPEAELFNECAIQSHVNQSVTYDLAFLEFNDQGKLRAPQQWNALQNHLRTSEDLNVLVFVHGWRNDASIGSADVRRFHTLLSLSANYAAQRKLTGTKTLGIFIGWRGRMLDEKDEHGAPSSLREALAIPTILSRKPRSDAIARPIGQQLLEIEKLVKGPNLDQHQRKLLIVGHSLGGNIVLQGLADTMVERMMAQSKPGAAIRGVGDLVLLLNPASQARQFFALQQAAFITKPAENTSPVLISLTPSQYYSRTAQHSNHWDTAVGKHLPTALRVLTLFSGQPEDIQSVGNFLPLQVMSTQTPTNIVSQYRYGVSHEIEIDERAGTATSYDLAGKLEGTFPRCLAESAFMEWQKHAVDEGKGPGWDASAPSKDGKKLDTRLKLVGPEGVKEKIKVNIRHGAVRHACTNKKGDSALCRGAAADAGIDIASDQFVRIPTIGQAWTPVWNAAVHSNTIEEHGGYLSHTLWCVLNRFALDKPPTNY
jgi:pimeloyl-ACP methyl ester carboxylesterase